MKLLQDITYAHNDAATFVISANKDGGNVILDLDGHSLTLESTSTTVITVNPGVHLTIKGGSLTARSYGTASDGASVVSCTGDCKASEPTLLPTSFTVMSGKVSLILESQEADSILNSANGDVTYKVLSGATLEMNSVTGKDFVKEGADFIKKTVYSFDGEIWTMAEINKYKGFHPWIAGTRPVKTVQSAKDDSQEDTEAPVQYKPDTSKRSDFAYDILRVSYPWQTTVSYLKAFKPDEKTLANVDTTITGYAKTQGKSAELLLACLAEPPISYVQGTEILLTVKNDKIKAGDVLGLNVYNEFVQLPAQPTQEFYTAVATKDGEVTFTVKHIGLLALFKLK